METKHTPGPWRYADDWETISSDARIQVSPIFCTIIHGHFVNYEEVKANAHLIAAAPELLEVLREITQRMELEKMGHHEPMMVSSIINMAKAAIKKATEGGGE